MPIGDPELETTNAVYAAYPSIMVSDGNSSKVYAAYPSIMVSDGNSSKVYASYVSVMVPAHSSKQRLNHRSFTMF